MKKQNKYKLFKAKLQVGFISATITYNSEKMRKIY